MAEIRDIGIRNVNIRQVIIPDRFAAPPRIPSAAPITEQVGVPIIDIPGCVEAHIENKRGKNSELVDDDPKGARVFCDGNMPSFNPINYNPDELDITQPPPEPPVVNPPEPPASPEVPKDAVPKVEEKEVECPPPNAPRIGDVAQNQKERVSGYELQNGICVTLYEDVPWTAQYLPAPQIAATTAGIAVVATSSALLAKPLADILLKVIKPAIKKVIAKVSKLRGKKVKIDSPRERRDLQRERSKAIRTLRRMKDGK
tara:strand:+ start:99 stop:869 length:771 start_codon:yes stop_codon:yes gene_type:complete